MNFDMNKVRRESMRWLVLRALDYGRPSPVHEGLLLSTMQGIFTDVTTHELRRELNYLDDRELIRLDRKPDGVWWAELTRFGIDVVEYTIDCEPGVGRPPRVA